MKDYRKLLPQEAPEGLIRAAIKKGNMDTAGLTYEVEWVLDTSLEALITDKVGKVKMVRCYCSECGQSFLMDWAPLAVGNSGRRVKYGFRQQEEYADTIGDGDCTLCPFCQTPVQVRHAPTVGQGEFECAVSVMLAASVLEGEAGEKPFVLTEYKVSRMVNRHGGERYVALPMEAYVFEGEECEKLKKWTKAYSGSCGYFVEATKEWHRQKHWHEDSGHWIEVFGLTPELLEESCMHNSKLIEYMDCESWRGMGKCPVPYLRQYQIHPQIENLITQGAGHIVNELIRAETGVSGWKDNDKGLTKLEGIDWTQKRPAQMLRLNKDEFRVMQDMAWDTYHWQLYTAAKEVGDVLRLPEDIEYIHQYGGEDLDLLIGQAPLGKCVRYLLGQIYQLGEQFQDVDEADENYNPYLDPYVDDSYIGASLLNDYWDMAKTCAWNLDNPAVRWPKCLGTAHDAAMHAMGMLKRGNYAQQFRERFVYLSRYIYMSGGLMIVPADSQEALDREGEMLDHCVARYGENHALGKSYIFFIRHTWAPDKPFYTLQFDEKREKVLQNRGKRNCDKTPEVQAFEDEWLAWVSKGAPRLADGTPVGAKPVEDEPPKPAEIKIIPKETNAA